MGKERMIALYVMGSLLGIVSLVLALTYGQDKRDVSSKLTTPLNAMPTVKSHSFDPYETIEMEWIHDEPN